MQYILSFTARPKICRYDEVCMCGCALNVTVIVCETLWCDHLFEELVHYQTHIPSPSLSALLLFHSDYLKLLLLLCVGHSQISGNQKHQDNKTKYSGYCLPKQLKSPAHSRWMIHPDTQPIDQGVREPADRTDSLAETDSGTVWALHHINYIWVYIYCIHTYTHAHTKLIYSNFMDNSVYCFFYIIV